MLEFLLTGNLGKEPRVSKTLAIATVCCNTPVKGEHHDTEPVWVDLQAPQFSRLGERLLELGKGDGVQVRGVMKINYYEHGGETKRGWIMDLNQLTVTHKA